MREIGPWVNHFIVFLFPINDTCQPLLILFVLLKTMTSSVQRVYHQINAYPHFLTDHQIIAPWAFTQTSRNNKINRNWYHFSLFRVYMYVFLSPFVGVNAPRNETKKRSRHIVRRVNPTLYMILYVMEFDTYKKKV